MVNNHRHRLGLSSATLYLQTFVLLVLLMAQGGCDDAQQQSTEQATSSSVKLRFGHDMTTDSAHHLAALRFAKLAEQHSQGRIDISIHPNQSLGNDHEMIAMAQAGELDIILPPTAKLANLVPAFQVVDLPFFFNDREEIYRVLDGQLGAALFTKLHAHDLTGVSFWESGFKQLTTDRAIRNHSDLHGLKFRIMRSAVIRDQFQAWGAETIAIDFGKTHQALADKVANGQENPLGSIFNMKFHEVQSHLILSNHAYLAQVLTFSNKSLARMPADLQQILFAAAHEVTTFQRKESAQREQIYLDKIKRSGIKITTLDPKTQQNLSDKSRTLMEKHRLNIGSAIIELALQNLAEHRPIANDTLLIALDADMAGNSAMSGLAIRRGIEIAIHEINNRGGVLGKKLQLIARDNSMVSARGIDNLTRFAQRPNLVAVFGGISSPVVLSEIDVIHENKILFLDPWAAATPIVENHHQPNYVFRLSVRDEYAAKFLLNNARKVSNKVALLLVNNGWGRSNYESIMQQATMQGLSFTAVKWFDWGDSNLHAKLEEIKHSGAKIILYVGNAVEAAKIIKYMDSRNIKIPVVSHWGIAGGDLPRLAGPALDKVDISVLQTFSFINNKTKPARNVIKLYKQLYGIQSAEEIVAAVGTAHAYDLTHLLAMAIRKAKRTDMPSIRSAMEQLGQYTGLLRVYNPAFTKARHDALQQSDYFLARYKNGILTPLSQQP